MNNKNTYLKTDDNRILNQTSILWAKKMSECFEVCMVSKGCKVGLNTHTICKSNNPMSYNILNAHFDEKTYEQN